ncbi:longitudinals lacking protein, isoforms F/I/K/T-like [Bombus vancouverensis nearcticus]|uniref:zinc finger protein 273-like n=1 Tax=Bombus vancouverensis nearcticus TaxID=2705178 RepID=UPI001438910E|nr:zinc finger protein 273-like [Bombus vancouverensis nearcticus]
MRQASKSRKCKNCEYGVEAKETYSVVSIRNTSWKSNKEEYSKRDHNRVNYDTPFTCYKCGKRYTWTDSLTRHLREGCGKLPRHKCTLCGRKFKRRDYLLRHENNVHKAE